MYKSIIISSCLFGSVYIFSKSLKLINESLLLDKKIKNKLIIINGLTFLISSSIWLCGINLITFYN